MLHGIKTSLQTFRAYRVARFWWHFARDPIFRRDHLLLWRRPARLYQHRSITLTNRYPQIFATAKELLPARPAPRLLSFGCATGEEVFALREHFPAATITGIDINPRNIADAEDRLAKRGGDPRISFRVGDSTDGEPREAYDAVFCMAVFVRWQLKERPDVATSLPHLDFADFNRAMEELAACVTPGGLLVSRHAMFRFEDTDVAAQFECVKTFATTQEFFPRFGRDNKRLPDSDREAVIFRKKVSR